MIKIGTNLKELGKSFEIEMDIFSHIQHIDNATRRWLQAENRSLKEAIDKTVQEGLFSFEDIKFAIAVV